MTLARGFYFDGRIDRRHEVGILLDGGRIKLVGTEVDASFDVRSVRVSPRIARIPRWIYLPDGGTCAVDDKYFLERLARESTLEKTLHKWESRPVYAALSVALVALGLWLMIDRGLPVVAQHVADRIPLAAESSLGEQTLSGMDHYVLKPSTLPAGRQEKLRAEFVRMTRTAELLPEPRLEFRASPVLGPNAFALPSGIVVVTDELVTLAHDDREVLAVLGHELGHVAHRHVMRQLLESSATALLIAGLTGDIVSTTSIAAAAPTLLIQAKYSRDNERDADQYSLDLLQRMGIEARYFAAMLQRLETIRGSRGNGSGFLSSHPATDERKALALGAGVVQEDERTPTHVGPPLAQKYRRTPTAPPSHQQSKVVDLLARGDYEALDLALQAYQAAFETDPGTSVDLETAFASLTKAPPELAPNVDEWVTLYPRSYVAAVARGGYYLSRGMDARGARSSADTPNSAIREMREHFRVASADLERSLALTEKPYLSHRYLLTISRYGDGANATKLHYQEAIRLAPQSVETRLAYMKALEPRWGGSYSAMEGLLADSRTALSDPQAVRRLAARIPSNHGDDAYREKDYSRALSYYDAATALDVTAENLCNRARALYWLNRIDESFTDAGRAFALDNPDHRCASTAVQAAPRVTDPDEVIVMMGKVIDMNPSDHEALVQRGWRYAKGNHADLAFADYSRAARLGNPYAQYEISSMYWQGKGTAPDREEAVVWMRRAAENGNAQAKPALERYLAALGRK